MSRLREIRAVGWAAALLVAASGCANGCANGCSSCGGGGAAAAHDAGGFEPPIVTMPAPSTTTIVAPITDAAVVRPSRGRPDASNVTATLNSGTASDLQSNAEHIATKARLCYRLKGPSGKTSLGGVSVRVAIDASGDVVSVTPENVEVDKVVLDCIVANLKRAHFASGGEAAEVSFAIRPPPSPEP